MQENRHDHEVGRDAMNGSNQPAVRCHKLDIFHRRVSVSTRGHVQEHQNKSGGTQHKEEDRRYGSEPERVTKAETSPGDLRGEPVQQEIPYDRIARFPDSFLPPRGG